MQTSMRLPLAARPTCRWPAALPRAAVTPSTSIVRRGDTVACQSQDPGKQLAIAASTLACCLAVLSPPAFADATQTTVSGENVGFLTNQDVDKRRGTARFKRAYDGHVALQNKLTGEYMDIKCDLQVPGTILLRDPRGQVYIMSYSAIKQVDLSDDDVVGALASDNFEKDMQAIQAVEEGATIRLELTREGFYNLVSMMDILEDAEKLGADPKNNPLAAEPAARRR